MPAPTIKAFVSSTYKDLKEILHEALRTPEERDLNLAALDRTRGSFAALVKAIKASPVTPPN